MWAVVLAESEIPEDKRQQVADALSEVVGMVPLDAMGAVRRAQGVLLDQTSEFTATRLAEKVAALGLPVGVAERPDTGRRWPTRWAAPTKTGLYAKPGGRERECFDWSSVHALSLARYVEVKSVGTTVGHMRPGGGLPIGLGATSEVLAAARRDMLTGSQSVSGDQTFVLDVFLRDPLLTLRIDARQFDYSYLGEHMAPRFEVNFHTFVSQLLRGATTAVRSPLLDRFSRGDLLEADTIADLKEFDLYNRWLLLAAAAFNA